MQGPLEGITVLEIVFGAKPTADWWKRAGLIRKIYAVSEQIDCRHEQTEILAFVKEILSLPAGRPGCIVEAGCFLGGSTAKFSLAAQFTGRELVVFDSFEGLPPNEEQHHVDIRGNPIEFTAGKYRGTLNQVRSNIARCGAVDVCRFVKGWFEESLPPFDEPIAALYLDVDLASSTQTCITG